jgi:hypothetical protein
MPRRSSNYPNLPLYARQKRQSLGVHKAEYVVSPRAQRRNDVMARNV